MESGFVEKTELAIEDIPVPYYCIILTAEQAKLVKGKKVEILKVDGYDSFEIRDKGTVIGRAVYVVFRP